MIDLNLGPDSVVPGDDFSPIDEGAYMVVCDDCEVSETKGKNPQIGKELMLVMSFEIIEGKFQGRKIRSWWTIPNNARKEFEKNTDKDSWNFMMDSFRNNLEALTGKEWRSDDMQLDPMDLPGYTAQVIIAHNPYTNKEGKAVVGNKIVKFLTGGDSTPAPAAPPSSGYKL